MAETTVSKWMTLIEGPEWLGEVKSPDMKWFPSLTSLLDHLCKNADDNDATHFRLVLPNKSLRSILDRKIADLEKVDSIDIFYQTPLQLVQDMIHYQNGNRKIHPRSTGDLATILASQRSNSPPTQAIATPKKPRRKKKSKKNKCTASVTANADVLCYRCSKVINDPFQLPCGHRQCKVCIDEQPR